MDYFLVVGYESKLWVTYYACMNLSPIEREIQRLKNLMRNTIAERICHHFGESSEKEYQTAFVQDQELCICYNSNIEPCYESVNDNGFVDIFNELHYSYNPLP